MLADDRWADFNSERPEVNFGFTLMFIKICLYISANAYLPFSWPSFHRSHKITYYAIRKFLS